MRGSAYLANCLSSESKLKTCDSGSISGAELRFSASVALIASKLTGDGARHLGILGVRTDVVSRKAPVLRQAQHDM